MRSRLLQDMFTNVDLTAASLVPHDGRERRSTPRIEIPFPTTVRGVDAASEPFELEAALANLSACGLYLRLERRVELGKRLFIVVRLSLAPTHTVPAPRVALHGMVLRTEPHADGMYGLALLFRRHRFLYAVTT
jgi:hypothetical protein